MRRTGGFPQAAPSNAGVMAQLKRYLSNCSDEKLASLTLDQLAPMYRMERRLLECTLLAAQDTRRRFLAKMEIGA